MTTAPEQIGPYSVERELGRGGMGVVSLARDPRLDRLVAIKALPEHVAQDEERLARFEREAKTLAQVSHPNIAGIHGIEEHDGNRYLVLEYVEGETLADVLDRGALSVDDAIEIAAQIAAGVEAAHDAGVIHRDLKPGNVIVNADSQAKVLDFGLARSDEASSSSTYSSDSPTITNPIRNSPTVPGVILGTAAYMSPEQARGRRVDKRTDIWSFGVLLYEMLTGASPFVGETASDSIGAVLHKEFDLGQLPPNTPANVRRVLERCLERDKSLRYRDIGDVRIELLRAEAVGEPATAEASTRMPIAMMLALILLAALLAGGAGWFAAGFSEDPPALTVRKIDVVVAEPGEQFIEASPQIAPDGLSVAFIRNESVHVRDLSSFDSRPIPGTEGARRVFWSPDSRWIGFTTERGIFRVPISGGGASRIVEVDSWYIPDWTADDEIIYAENSFQIQTSGINSVSSRGGSPVQLIDGDPETTVDFHAALRIPETDVLVSVRHYLDGRTPLIVTDGSRTVTLVEEEDMYATMFTWSPSGHILYTRGFGNSDVWAIPFSPSDFRATGSPFLVRTDAAFPSVSDNGTLAILRGERPSGGEIVTLTVDDEKVQIETIGSGGSEIFLPLLSPDGTRVAFVSGKSSAKADIWVRDINRGTNSRVSFNDTFTAPISWSPDGREIAILRYKPTDEKILQTQFLAADGSGPTRPPFDGAIGTIDTSWTYAVEVSDPRLPKTTITAIALENYEQLGTLVDDSTIFRGDNGGTISPDGTLFLYTSRTSGQNEVVCTTFPNGEGRWKVSADGGFEPSWSPDGSTVYYRHEDTMYTVSLTRDPQLRFGRPEPFIGDSAAINLNEFENITSTPQANRFVAINRNTTASETDPLTISIIENWYEEFREDDGR